MNRGVLLVVSGPSGSGKGTVIKQLMKIQSGLSYSVSATTREPRPGEVDGQSYYFLSHEEFERQIRSGRMLEHVEYCGNYYGTPRTAVDDRLREGLDVLLEIEVQGAANIKDVSPECVSVFLMPPSMQELERRLRCRGTESDEALNRRLTTACREVALARRYDYIVTNDDVDLAARQIAAILTAEKCKTARRSLIIEEVLNHASICH